MLTKKQVSSLHTHTWDRQYINSNAVRFNPTTGRYTVQPHQIYRREGLQLLREYPFILRPSTWTSVGYYFDTIREEYRLITNSGQLRQYSPPDILFGDVEYTLIFTPYMRYPGLPYEPEWYEDG